MATSALPLNRTSPFTWLWSLLRDELAPYPGRGALVARMVASSGIVTLIVMTFQVPYGAYAALYALTISRESPDATLKDAKNNALGLTLGAAYVLIGAIVFSGEPVVRLAWVLATLFLMFFALSVVANYTVAARFGYLVAITIPLWDRIIPSNEKVTGTLWAIASLTMANVIAFAVELIYSQLYHPDTVTVALVDRLQSTASLLRTWSAGISDPAIEQKLTRFSILGTSRMRRDLLRSGPSPEFNQRMGAVVALVGRLIDVAANLTHFPPQTEDPERSRIQQLAGSIESLAEDLRNRRVPQQLQPAAQPISSATTPLLPEMEQTVFLIPEVLRGYASFEQYRIEPITQQRDRHLLRADAFSNPNHVQFAIRGGLAAASCYLAYNLVSWPGISTAVTTCFLTALTTVGASRQKQVLRFLGAIVGGLVLGFGAQLFILPGIDSISGFLVLFAAVTIFAAWISTSGPRLSYFGVQVALAFYLINLQEFKFQTSLGVARDRVVGVLLGLFAMWLIFDQLWEASAAVEMRRAFVSSLRFMAELMREPISSNERIAVERTDALRETINTNFDKLRQFADGVMLEFGPSREANLAERAQVLQWQLQLRVMFTVRSALSKFRFRRPGFELPEPIVSAQQTFDTQIAAQLDGLADSLQGKAPPVLEKHESSMQILEKTVQAYSPDLPSDPMAARLRSFLPLCSQVESLVSSLEGEILRWLNQSRHDS